MAQTTADFLKERVFQLHQDALVIDQYLDGGCVPDYDSVKSLERTSSYLKFMLEKKIHKHKRP